MAEAASAGAVGPGSTMLRSEATSQNSMAQMAPDSAASTVRPHREESSRSNVARKPANASQQQQQQHHHQSNRFMEPEVEFAEIELRIRKFNLDLIQPTIHKAAMLEQNLKDVHTEVVQATATISALQKQGTQIEQQVILVNNFREEMSKWDVERRQKQADMTEGLASTKHELDGFRYSLERKDATIHGLQRTVDRAVSELVRLQESTELLQQRVDKQFAQHARQVNCTKTELEVRLVSLEARHNRLSDELWGDQTGLAKITTAHERTNQLAVSLGEELVRLQHDKASVSQLETVQEAVDEVVRDSSTKTAALKHTVDTVVEDVKEHFRTATNTVAAHNATMITEVRAAYQDEVGASAHLRGETVNFIRETNGSISTLGNELHEAQEQTAEMVKKLQADIDELQKFRKHYRSIATYEEKTLQDAVSNVHASSDVLSKGIDHLSSIVYVMLQSERMACAMAQQDDSDRAKVALMGFRESKETKVGESRTAGSAQGRAASAGGVPRPRGKAGREVPPMALDSGPPVISVDHRCWSCSGQANSVLSGFKMACLNYAPGAVTFARRTYVRNEIAELRQKLLEQAHEAVLHGPPGVSAVAKRAAVANNTSGGGGGGGAESVPLGLLQPQVSQTQLQVRPSASATWGLSGTVTDGQLAAVAAAGAGSIVPECSTPPTEKSSTERRPSVGAQRMPPLATRRNSGSLVAAR
eukprot:NODE_1318_length_2524_cov_6.987067.p1 GENE.NODE_1318_length_2524_cov_6.987067~~NODE_1318_length_2524_cov_6.987067.p1  ORF type:complete len:703 (+),score=216.70 NODE_1318_length_2524_cov_6.987067:158-2266(+)